jgi:hypothetical protein
MKPNFIGIGAQKCASSWLYDILADHPQAAVSAKKELDFFSYHYERSYVWYERQFPEKPAGAIGEISPSYFNEASVPARAKLYSPDLRILLSLRDPVERALSQHRHLVRIGYVQGPDYSFETALANNPSYVEQGRYAVHLERWLSYFPRERIHVVLMDDIKRDAEAAARGVYAFLGIDEDHRSAALHERSNPSYVVRHPGLGRTIDTLRDLADRTGLGPVWRGAGRMGAQRLYRKLNRKSSEAVIPAPRPETLERLRQSFREDFRVLEGFLGRGLPTWQ